MLVLCAIFGFTLAAVAPRIRASPAGSGRRDGGGSGMARDAQWVERDRPRNDRAVGGARDPARAAGELGQDAHGRHAIGALIVVGAVAASSATTLGGKPALEWENWSLRGPGREASSVRFVWDSNYEGISFPPTKTEVLRVSGPDQPYYWRATTLDLFTDYHWVEDPFWLGQVDHAARALQLPQLVPDRAADQRQWIEQKVRIEALVDDHLVAAGTPVGLDAQRFGSVFQLSDGVLRVRDPMRVGQTYTVWSYAPDPAPRALASAPVRHPRGASRFWRSTAECCRPSTRRTVTGSCTPSSATLVRRDKWQATMYDVAQRVAGRASTPYGAVLALESWFRQTGGFHYDESHRTSTARRSSTS